MFRSSVPLVGLLLVSACEPADDVRVLPLPSLERLTPEARLGIPEIVGAWQFAGWEIVRGDTTSLERTFPSFGALNIQGQRLDSVAGTFALGGQPTPVVGEVRRDGWIALATMNGDVPTGYVTGQLDRDTLWLELTSVMPTDEWPRDSRAAFVQGAGGTPIVWLRGTIPGQPTLPAADSLGAALDSLGQPVAIPSAPATGAPSPQVPSGAGAAATGQQPAAPPPAAAPRPAPAPTTPPAGQTSPPAAAPVVPPPAPPPPPPPPPPDPEPAPESPQGPPLLGVPIERPSPEVQTASRPPIPRSQPPEAPMPARSDRPFQGGSQPVRELPPESPTPARAAAQTLIIGVAVLALLAALLWIVVPFAG